jgi:hypothetical protein
LLESFQGLAQAFVFDRERFTKLGPRLHSVFAEKIQHSLLNVTSFLATDVLVAVLRGPVFAGQP